MADQYNNSAQIAAMTDYASNIGATAMTISANEDMYERALIDNANITQANRQYAYAMLQDQRSYNDPLSVRGRLEAAGISPWTAFGQMATPSDASKPVDIPSVKPMTSPQFPGTNMMGVYAMNMQREALNSQMASEKLAREQQAMQNRMLEHYLEKEMERDAKFRGEEQNFQRAQWEEAQVEWERNVLRFDQIVEEHKARMQEINHNLEMLDKYDEKTRAAQLANIYTAGQKLYYDVINAEKEGRLIEEHILQRKEEILRDKIVTQKEQLELDWMNDTKDERKEHWDLWNEDLYQVRSNVGEVKRLLSQQKNKTIEDWENLTAPYKNKTTNPSNLAPGTAPKIQYDIKRNSWD